MLEAGAVRCAFLFASDMEKMIALLSLATIFFILDISDCMACLLILVNINAG